MDKDWLASMDEERKKDIIENVEDKSVVSEECQDFNISNGELWGYRGDSTEIIFPEGVQKINCVSISREKLEKAEVLRLPESLEIIDEFSLQHCKVLKSIVIPKNVKKIGRGAFNWCEALEEVVVEGNPQIEEGAFDWTPWKNKNLEKNGAEIVGVKLVKVNPILTEYTVPSSVREIGRDAFRNTDIKKVIVSEGVEEIGICAFMDTPLEYISLPKTLKVIDAYAFDGCENLVELIIPKSVYRIGDNAFKNLPSCVITFLNEEDDEEEFNISTWSFSMRDDCNVKEVRAPFGSVAYRVALKSKLNVVKLPGNPRKYEIIDNAFCCVDGVLVDYFGQHEVLTLPEGIVEIGDNVFNSANFKKVYLPKSVKKISEFAFADCENLIEVVGEGVEEIEFQAFYDCANLQRVEFPSLDICVDAMFTGCDKLKAGNIIVPEGARFLDEDLDLDIDLDLYEDGEDCSKDYYFSPEFIEELETKSNGFQREFYGIIDGICSYMDTEEEIIDFQKFIEQNHSYNKPGNILYHSQTIMGGTYTEDEYETLRGKVHNYLLGLFDDYGAAEPMIEVPHIIVCISAPEGCFKDDDIQFIKSLISFERICRGCIPAMVTTIVADTLDGRGNSCFVATIK